MSLNATQAYREVYGVSQANAERSGPRLLGNVGVAALIAEGRKRQAEKAQVTAELVFQRLWDIATADPRELIEYRRTCCRYCYGHEFRYQRTVAEMAKHRSSWEAAQNKKSTEQFDEEGGVGYNATKEPHPDCPECFGEGAERAFVHDTRKLSPSALCLYAGVKVSKDGSVEVKLHDQPAALVHVARHLGMFDGEGPLPPGAKDPSDVARQVRAALRAIADADGIRAA